MSNKMDDVIKMTKTKFRKSQVQEPHEEEKILCVSHVTKIYIENKIG